MKNFNYLKYKQNSATKETPQPTKHKTGFPKTCATVVQSTNNTNPNVSTIEKFGNTNAENESQTLLNKLKILNLNKRLQSRGKSPSGSTSKTRQESSPRDKEIENLKNEMQILKQSQTNSITGDNPKNAQMASAPGGQTTNNEEIINVLTFIQQTMETPPAINEQLKAKLAGPSGHIINLSKHSFSLDTCKLLNKNLNFVPTPKKYNKKQLDNDAENFFCRIKFELTSKISTQSRTQIKKTYRSK